MIPVSGLVPPSNKRWYVVATKGGAEWAAYVAITRAGMDCIFPRYVEGVARSRWQQGVLRPLFPGYVIAGLEPHDSALDIERLPPVAAILRDGPNYAVLNDAHVEELRTMAQEALENSEPKPRPRREYKEGDWVPVPHGVLHNVPCRIISVDKSGRVVASCGNVKVEFDVASLCAATSA